LAALGAGFVLLLFFSFFSFFTGGSLRLLTARLGALCFGKVHASLFRTGFFPVCDCVHASAGI
jgi:hypothetical protein